MILERNISNKKVFTLSEKTTLLNVFYLFEITCTQDLSKFYFIGSDLSTNKIRYNEFLLDVSLFVLNGSYTYKIYEQASNTNLDVLLTGALIENGRIKVIGETNNISVFESTQTIKVFND